MRRQLALLVPTMSQMGKAVEQGGGHLGIADTVGHSPNSRLLVITEALVEFADEVEQQLAAGAGERQAAELVEHDEDEPGKLGRQRSGLADPGIFLKPVHSR